MRYVIKTPHNPQYNGVTYHVQFKDGRAVIDEYTLPKRPGFEPSLEQLVTMFRNDLPGYQVEALVSDEPASALVYAEPEAEAPKPAAAKKATAKKTGGRKKLPED